MTRSDIAHELRAAFQDPRQLCDALGIGEKSKRQAGGGLTILCPAHGERTPSCSVTRGPDGSVRVRCFGCDFTGDALTLIAVARGLEVRGQFREVLEVAAELSGRHDLLDELRGTQGAAPRQPPAPRVMAPPPPERSYPERNELVRLWSACTPVAEDDDARAELARRGLDPSHVGRLELARVLPPDYSLPTWARYQGRTWNGTGHRMIVRAWDSHGLFRSVRAWRIVPGESPKRLPPAGRKAAELVLANRAGVDMLRGNPVGSRVVITEGEPDWCVWSAKNANEPVIGIGSGSWTQAFADRVPYGAEVTIRTHLDVAGEKYAQAIVKTLSARAGEIRRLALETEAA
jgi:hypothetical protein